MDTTRIIGFRHPSQVELLLDALMTYRRCLPAAARRIRDRSDLPAAVQRVVIQATKADKGWSAWTAHGAIWCYIAEVIPARMGGEKCRALRVSAFDAKGRQTEHGIWAAPMGDDSWRHYVAKSR